MHSIEQGYFFGFLNVRSPISYGKKNALFHPKLAEYHTSYSGHSNPCTSDPLGLNSARYVEVFLQGILKNIPAGPKKVFAHQPKAFHSALTTQLI